MAPDRSGRISSTGVTLIIIGCLVAGGLVCLGVIVLAITGMGTSVNSPYEKGGMPIRLREETEQTATKFLKDLCAGNSQAAWEQTSPGFQNSHATNGDPDQSKFFTDFLKEHPGLRDPAAIEVKSLSADIQQATVQATITTKSRGKIIVHLKLTLKMKMWMISDLAVLVEKKENDVGKKKLAPGNDKSEF